MTITKKTCEDLRNELKKVLPDISKKLGVAIKVGNINYSSQNANVKLECSAVDDGVDVSDAAAVAEADFKANVKLYDGKPDWFGKELLVGGDVFTVSGLNKKARVNCFLITNVKSGKVYSTSTSTIREGLKLFELAKAGS